MDLVRKSLLRISTWPMSTWNVSFEIPWSISFCRRLHSSTRKAWRANPSCRYSHQCLEISKHMKQVYRHFWTFAFIMEIDDWAIIPATDASAFYIFHGKLLQEHLVHVCVLQCAAAYSFLWCCSSIAFVYEIQVRVQYPQNKYPTNLTESSSEDGFGVPKRKK